MNFEGLSVEEMMRAGVHFGHKKSFWNPKMSPYIYGTTSNGIHVVDLRKTYYMFNNALEFISKIARNKGRVLFVGTKMQATKIIEEEALRCGQYYVNHTWLGGTLTNWSTISKSIKKLVDCEKALHANVDNLTKKELTRIEKKRVKLDRNFRGVRNMGGVPDLLFVIDAKGEEVAIREAKTLGIPVVALVDTNSDPQYVDYVIPGNDDSTKAISYCCRLVSNAVLTGIKMDLASSGLSMTEKASIGDIETTDESVGSNQSTKQEASEKHKQAAERAENDTKKPSKKLGKEHEQN